MSYIKVYFRIRSDYSYGNGWSSVAAEGAFREETRRLFAGAGWTVEVSNRTCISDTVKKGPQQLYLHPMNFSGVVEDVAIAEIETLLAQPLTFHWQGTDCYEKFYELSDEEYWAWLEGRREEITAAILERYKTKRRNLYFKQSLVLSIAAKFSVPRICDIDGEHEKANLFVGELVEQMIGDGRLVTAQTRHGGIGVRTATKQDKLSVPGKGNTALQPSSS